MNAPLLDLRDFHDESGRLADLPRGPEASVSSWPGPEDCREPERYDAYLRRLEAMEKAGLITPQP